MSSIGSLLHSPEAAKSPSVAPGQLSSIEEHGAQLLELRTEVGPVYVCPSRMQRIRLQWTFRHFRVLPEQVLSRRDQRLIERLSHSAVVKPAFPVTSDAVLGVVEKVRSKSPAPANRAVTLKTEVAIRHAFPAKSGVSGLLGPVAVKPIKIREVPRGLSSWDPGFHQWGALGALATVCLAVILASGYGILPTLKPPQVTNLQTLSIPIDHAANPIKQANLPPATSIALLVAPITAELPNVGIPKRRVAAPPAEPVTAPRQATEALDQSTPAASVGLSPMPTPAPRLVPNPEVTPTATDTLPERRFVSGLPPGHFAHPVVSDPNLVGELRMKALIGADGSVKKVTVLSGNPKLAAAAMRAVRQWHYTPYQVLGKPTEVETQIKMNFFGEDAVSIASVSNGAASQPE